MTEDQDILDEIIAASERAADWLLQLQSLVRQARLDGATWQEIADALGVSKQAAQQRFGSRRREVRALEIAPQLESLFDLP
jgi:hypothetical protein